MDLPYEAMRTFGEVARQGSFSRAGQVLLRSQSAVSISVAKLEEVAGHRLLDRTTKRVDLTGAVPVAAPHFVEPALHSLSPLSLGDMAAH